MPWLFIAFIAIPLIEISLFVTVGQVIGLWPTLAIVISTAVLGSWLLRKQGAREMGRLRASMEQFRDPTGAMFSGALLIFAGALLLTPGYLTDFIGLTLMIPTVREWFYRQVASRVSMQSHTFTGAQSTQNYRPRNASDDVIDGEYETVEPSHANQSNPSGWVHKED